MLNHNVFLSFFIVFLNSLFISNSYAQWGNAAPVASEQMMLETTSKSKFKSKNHFSSKDKKTFSRLYKNKKRPKFIILFNKQLSGDVDDWRSNERLVISNETQIAFQRKNQNNRQLNFPQQWIWQFEQGFVQHFENLRVRLVDINTAKRLTASAQMDSHSGVSGMVGSLKKNEIDALSGYADYYIELVIIRSTQAAQTIASTLKGYQLKASMIDTKTGEIIARVNSLSWGKSNKGVYRASKYGYSKQKNNFTADKGDYEGSKHGYVQESTIEIGEVTNYLAEALIKKINYAWGY